MIETLYQGSVKNLMGPIKVGAMDAVIFDYTDAYSVFDWGRMPDQLPKKGESLAVIAADWFEKLERHESWVEYSKSTEALGLRKGNRFGAVFNELGEVLQQTGLRTHYIGVCGSNEIADQMKPRKTVDTKQPIRHLLVQEVSVEKPTSCQVLNRSIPDYTKTRASSAPRLVPLEVVFRFSCPPGSSLLERARDPHYMASIGYGDLKVAPGEKWDFPVLETFTKLETTDRIVSLSEALAISGLTGPQLQEVLFKTAWVAGYLKFICARVGLELADGKLEWAVDQFGEVFLVDAIGPDELRILKDGVQLSKEFLRNYYRKTPWFESVNKAKENAKTQGISEWKRLVNVSPQSLPADQKELASQVYMALANQLTGRTWFPSAWDLNKVILELKKI